MEFQLHINKITGLIRGITKMNIRTFVRKYIPSVLIFFSLYIIAIGFYYFFGYGTVLIPNNAYVTVNGFPYGQKDKLKLRPGTYQITAKTIDSFATEQVKVSPFKTRTLPLKEVSQTDIIRSLTGNKTLIVSNSKVFNNKWLVARVYNDEINQILVLQYQGGEWIQVSSYTLPEAIANINNNYFTKIVPANINAYIQQELLR